MKEIINAVGTIVTLVALVMAMFMGSTFLSVLAGVGVVYVMYFHDENLKAIVHSKAVEEYNRTCREEVMKYTAEWEEMTQRVGYWVDMNDPYITYDNRYIETLWHLLRNIYDKGLLYKNHHPQRQ